MKTKLTQRLHFLMVDSDEDDTILMQEAFGELSGQSQLNCVKDEVQLLDYLDGKGVYQDRALYPLPNIILLELRAPINATFDVLSLLKASSTFRRVPVVIFANSHDVDLVARAYDLGAASYIVKPNTFDALLNIMSGFNEYWTMCARPVMMNQTRDLTELNEQLISSVPDPEFRAH